MNSSDEDRRSYIGETPESKKAKKKKYIDYSANLGFYDLNLGNPVTETVSELMDNNTFELSNRAWYVITKYIDPDDINKLNFNNITQQEIDILNNNFDQRGNSLQTNLEDSQFSNSVDSYNEEIKTPSTIKSTVNTNFSLPSQMSLTPMDYYEYVDPRQEFINSAQLIFNKQEPTLVNKVEMKEYNKQYQEYWELDLPPENQPPIANPKKCFTHIEIKSKLLLNDLNAAKMCYKWRDIGYPVFGISGALSIAGLTILAMRTLNVICNSDNLEKIQKKKNFKKKPDFSSSSFYQKNYQTLFNGAFKNIDSKSGEGENRSNLDSIECLNLTTAMLNVMDEFLNNYFIFVNTLSESENQGLTDFLRDSYLLLRKIILIKSSLDVSMAEGLTDLVQFNQFCLFDSYDLSAVFNSPYCPTLSYLQIPGFNKISLIYDDIAIFSYFSIINYIIKIFGELNENDIVEQEQILEEIKKRVKISDMSNDHKELYNNLIEMSIDNKKLFDKDFYNDLDISSNSKTSKKFTNFLDKIIGEKTIYIHLREMALSDNEKELKINKSMYESISKLFLNYNVKRNVLNFEEITSNSRDIRAHDYAHSPIRFFGISLYIKKQICDFLHEKKQYEKINLNSIDNEVFIKREVTRLSNEDNGFLDELVNFILNRESIKLKDKYKTLKKNLVNLNASGKPIAPYMAIYNNFLNGSSLLSQTHRYSYEPLDGYVDEIQNIYYLMCCQTAMDFESSQVVDGFDKAIIFQIHNTDTTKPIKVYMNNKQIFTKDNSSLNKLKAESLKQKGITLINYNFPVNTMGIVDLHHKNGIDEIIYGTTVQNTVNEADAASSFRGFYNFSLYIHKTAPVFYNSISCATIFSGDYEDKYEIPIPNPDDEQLIKNLSGKSLIYFIELINAEKYDINAKTALPMIDYFISENYQNIISTIINKIKNEEIKNEITEYYKQLISSFTSYYQMEQKSKNKKELAQRVSNEIKKYIKIFIQNTQRVAACDKEAISILNKIGKEFYHTLLDDDVKIYMMIDQNTMRTSERSRESGKLGKSGKLGGAKNECENIIKNKEKDVPFDLYIGKFGSYIDAENGNLVLKAINTEEELKNIEMRLGIYNDLKEEQNQTTPIKPPINTTFLSPTSVEELNLSPPEKKQRITEEINEGINEEINGGKTIKRRRRIKRKTRRIKNKSKHRKTVKLMKKRAKMTKGRKPRQ